jgi:hypothetical protein
VPTPLTIAIMATEMPAAISPYSMAVAPDSSPTKRFTIDMSPPRVVPLGENLSERSIEFVLIKNKFLSQRP